MSGSCPIACHVGPSLVPVPSFVDGVHKIRQRTLVIRVDSNATAGTLPIVRKDPIIDQGTDIGIAEAMYDPVLAIVVAVQRPAVADSRSATKREQVQDTLWNDIHGLVSHMPVFRMIFASRTVV